MILQSQTMEVSNILPFTNQDSLKVDFSLLQVWEGKITRNLLAGIPLDLRLVISLLNAEQQLTLQRSFTGLMVYDVWEEKFSLQGLNIFPASFSQFSDLKDRFAEIKEVGVCPIETLLPQMRYQLQIDFSVLLLNKKQNQELERWMQTAELTEEEFASSERSTGFRLNLNQLVQLFFSGNKEPEKFQVSDSSLPFTVEDLLPK